MLTSIAYLPGVGLALAGTTLVGQAIGAGDRDWARRLGNAVIVVTVGLHGHGRRAAGAAPGPWVMPTVRAARPIRRPRDVVELGVVLLWIAAGYQLFDGLQLGSGFALRGAGDVRVPALIFLALSWGVFVPLAHMLSFAPGQGWFDVLPQFGYGAVGGWIALLVYVVLLGGALNSALALGRWRIRIRAARRPSAATRPTPSGLRSRTSASSSGARASGRRAPQRRPGGDGLRHVARPAHVHERQQVDAGELRAEHVRAVRRRCASTSDHASSIFCRSASRTIGGCSAEPEVLADRTTAGTTGPSELAKNTIHWYQSARSGLPTAARASPRDDARPASSAAPRTRSTACRR